MSSSSDLETVFQTSVFDDENILLFSNKVYFHAVSEDSEFELEKLLLDGEINFFQCLIARSHYRGLTERDVYDFTIEISYFRTKSEDPSGANWTSIRDALETIYEVVRDEAGETLGGTVDFWRPQEGPPEITEVALGDEKVWLGTYTFTATQSISI